VFFGFSFVSKSENRVLFPNAVFIFDFKLNLTDQRCIKVLSKILQGGEQFSHDPHGWGAIRPDCTSREARERLVACRCSTTDQAWEANNMPQPP